MKTEREFSASSGYLWIVLLIIIFGVSLFGIIALKILPLIAVLCLSFFLVAGFVVVNPNDSCVLVLFGDYKGTIKENGFYFVNPFFVKKKISLRARNFDSETLKVNDKIGNPIMIGIVLVWKVEDTFKAAFEVDDYEHFVRVQSEAALRKLAGHYPYDNFEPEAHEITLRAGGEEVNDVLEKEVTERLSIAGIKVIEARINYLAYAQEIAQAMLRRQQATAIVAAREKIVEGAVGMVELALNNLSAKKIIELDDDKKAAMVSNLMVVLCSDDNAQPVINTGTLYQ